ncbi:MAG TPA: hypothetical protein VKS60_05485 [Stellaceae bacterium]|nr:hypothetical protein [Stellaceae bacterium]
MSRSLEEIIGKLEKVPKITGTRPGEADRVRYVDLGNQRPSVVFDRITSQAKPHRATHGGVVLDNCFVTLPDDSRFCSLVFNLDLEGWRRQIEDGARELGWRTARIDADNFIVSDGRSVPLSECKIDFEQPD